MCENCNQDFTIINKNIYFFENYYIKKILNNYNISNDLIHIIQEFLYPESYTVFSDKKTRNKELNCDPDDYFIYTINEYNLCIKCFIVGIDYCLTEKTVLPHLRNDINYFLDNDENIIKKYYKKYKYDLPTFYYCKYYRDKNIKLVNNKIKIKSY